MSSPSNQEPTPIVPNPRAESEIVVEPPDFGRLQLPTRKGPILNRDLDSICAHLDAYFDLTGWGPDVAFAQWVPSIYDGHGIPWRQYFEPSFNRLFNGLMLKGEQHPTRMFVSAFPSRPVLEAFLANGAAGDIFFTHHALDYRSGRNEEELGAGFLPIPVDMIERMIDRRLSFYSCHAPLDYHREIGTTASIVKTLPVEHVLGAFCGEAPGCAGVVVQISPMSTPELLNHLKVHVGVERLDIFGPEPATVSRVAIVAGEATSTAYFAEAEALGAQVYIAGEVMAYARGAWGEERRAAMRAYLPQSQMMFIGISHGASEHRVMQHEFRRLIEGTFELPLVSLAERNWWR